MTNTAALLIIDPQNDFCDLPESWWGHDPISNQKIAPALPVSGAHADMLRLSTFIQENVDSLSDITVTLDSHHRLDIAHPGFWKMADGSAVAPFTQITAAQVRANIVTPKDPCAVSRTLAYLDELERRGRYTLMVWPAHCEIGGWGHNIHASIHASCQLWEEKRLRIVHTVFKGINPWTEHYSALQAEVPDPADPHTQLNSALISKLAQANTLLIAGEASSHCVKSTVEHLVENSFHTSQNRIVLLTDCMSPVFGFETHTEAFLSSMRERGIRLATSTQLSEELRRT